MDALTDVLEAIKQLDLPLQCYFHPCIQHKLMHTQQLFTVCVCTVRITVSLCFSCRVNCLHEIEHFSCWFTMKWCACVGLCCVSFSKSNGGVTEREKVGESLVHLQLLLLLQSITQSEHCAIWTNSLVKTDIYGNTNTQHPHTSIELQVHGP